jgi:chromosome partitioning protein
MPHMNVTVMNHKGGVGKTVTAIHLAAFLAREFGRESTVLVDTDPNEGALEWAARGRLPGL